MAVAVVQDFLEEETDRSTKNYDAIHARITAKDGGSSGLIIHTAGFTGKGFRIFEVWESQEQFDNFMQETVMPIVMEVGGGNPGRPPEVTVYELHNVYAP